MGWTILDRLHLPIRQACGVLGWNSEEMITSSFHALLHHTRVNQQPYPWNECPIRKTLLEGTTERVQNEVFWRKDGTSFPVEYVATPMREGREIVGAVVTFQDITERKLSGEPVGAGAEQLESIGQLAAGIAHEINTPTQFIGDNLRFLEDAFADLRPLLANNAQLLSAAEGSQRTRERFYRGSDRGARNRLRVSYGGNPQGGCRSRWRGVERVAKIVRSMKEFSHPGSDEKQPVDLNRALESTLTVCRNEWKYVADVVVDFDSSLPLVHCLPSACNQVFLNLIINAAHAIADKQKQGSKDKGTITVRTRADGEWVEVSIADTRDRYSRTTPPSSIRSLLHDKGSGEGNWAGAGQSHARWLWMNMAECSRLKRNPAAARRSSSAYPELPT